jgi:hypothetical protein
MTVAILAGPRQKNPHRDSRDTRDVKDRKSDLGAFFMSLMSLQSLLSLMSLLWFFCHAGSEEPHRGGAAPAGTGLDVGRLKEPSCVATEPRRVDR